MGRGRWLNTRTKINLAFKQITHQHCLTISNKISIHYSFAEKSEKIFSQNSKNNVINKNGNEVGSN